MTAPTTCQLCNAPIRQGEHYVIRIDVFADPAMPHMTAKELATVDLDEQLQSLLEQMQHMSTDDLQDDVHRRFEYRVCRACQRQVLGNPLGLPRSRKTGTN